MIKVTKLLARDGRFLDLDFSDGSSGTYDCENLLSLPGPMSEPLKNPNYFAQAFVEMGAPTWPNGFDLAPWALHKDLRDSGLLRPTPASAAE